MKFRYLLFSIILFYYCNNAYNQTIHGTISGTDKLPIPYATIYVQQQKSGTASNANGKFDLKIPPGKYDIEFRALGYQPKKVTIEVLKDNVELNEVLEEQIYNIKEITVKKGDEDPAYSIMRKAISLAPYYQSQVKHYKSKYYIKVNFNLIFLPKYILALMKLDKTAPDFKSGGVYFVESLNEVDFDAPDKYFQKVVSFKSTYPGMNNAQPMYLPGSFYQTKYLNGISPLASNAFGYYKFRYEGVSFENGISILKIRVMPKFKGNNLFEGIIYLVDNSYNLYSIDLSLPIDMGKRYIKQQYMQVNSSIWLPATLSAYDDMKGFGAKAAFEIATSIKYDVVESNTQQLTPKWLKRDVETESTKANAETKLATKSRKQKKVEELLSKENPSTRDMLKIAALMKKQAEEDTSKKTDELLDDNKFKYKIEPNALKADSNFWNESRPIPLTSEEIKSVRIKDSIILKYSLKDTLRKDSLPKKQIVNNISPFQFITSHTWRDSLNNEIQFSGLVNPGQFWFNTVDGFGYGMQAKVLYKIDSSYTYTFEPQVGYAFSRNSIYWNTKAGLIYSPKKMGNLNIDMGHWSSDFNSDNGIKRGLNTISSLFFRTNYMKLYDSRYLKIDNSIELYNGFVFKMKLVYDKRMELTNKSNYSFFYNTKRNYTSNTPNNVYVNNQNTGDYTALNFDAGFEYTPMMHYRYGANKAKWYVGSDYPTFSVNIKKGIPGLFQSNSDFIFASAGISQQFKWGIASKFDYHISFGGFPVNKNIHFADFYHVSTQEIPVLFTNPPVTNFSLLNYYKESTSEHFAEAHINFTSAYLALKFLPLMNLTNLRENLSLGLLSTPQTKGYMELSYGLSNLPMKGAIYYVAGFDQNHLISQGFKLVFFFTNSIVIGGE